MNSLAAGFDRRVLSFPKFVKMFLITTLVFVSSMGILSISDEEDCMLILRDIQRGGSAFLGKFTNGASNVLGNSSIDQANVKVTTKLNLDLIDRIPDSASGTTGYIKELLSMYRDEENKKIHSGSSFNVATLIGMHTNEGAYRKEIPVYYFNPEDWKKDTAHYCLKDFTTKSMSVSNKGGVNERLGFGVFQHLNSPSGVKSKIEPLSVKRGASPGDCRFLPDAITTSAALLKDAFNCIPKKTVNDDAVAMLAGISNNRGGYGAASYMAGCRDLYSSSSKSLNHLTSGKFTKEVSDNTINQWAKLYTDYYTVNVSKMKADVIPKFDTPKTQVAACIIAVHSPGWYFNQKAYDYLKSNEGNIHTVWDALYPSEKDKSKRMDMLKARVATISESIHKECNDSTVSAADCESVYGTDTYLGTDYNFRNNRGSVWHVSQNRDTGGFYKNRYSTGKRPYFVSAVDYIGAGYTFSVSGIVGKYVYANLLKKAGVNEVDPTNPATYMKTITTKVVNKQVTTEWVSELDSVYKGHGIDMASLTPDRKAVLNKAAEMAYHKPFCYEYGVYRKKPYTGPTGYGKMGLTTDCAHFCELAHYYAGFTVTHEPTSTLVSSSKYFEKIPLSKAKPGDIVVYSGHAEMYLSGTSFSKLVTIGARSAKRYSFEDSVSIINRSMLASGRTTYIVRHKDIDKNKRGKMRDVPDLDKGTYPSREFQKYS